MNPETHDVYATIEAMGEGVEVSLVKYETGAFGAQHEVRSRGCHLWLS